MFAAVEDERERHRTDDESIVEESETASPPSSFETIGTYNEDELVCRADLR